VKRRRLPTITATAPRRRSPPAATGSTTFRGKALLGSRAAPGAPAASLPAVDGGGARVVVGAAVVGATVVGGSVVVVVVVVVVVLVVVVVVVGGSVVVVEVEVVEVVVAGGRVVVVVAAGGRVVVVVLVVGGGGGSCACTWTATSSLSDPEEPEIVIGKLYGPGLMSAAAEMVIVIDHWVGFSSTGVEKDTVNPPGGLAEAVGAVDDPNPRKVWLDSPCWTGLAEMVAAAGAAMTATRPMAAMSGLAQRSVFTGSNLVDGGWRRGRH